MARVTVEDCLKNVDNRFELVLLASKRARLLSRGVEPLVPAAGHKPAVLALLEIANVDRALLDKQSAPIKIAIEDTSEISEEIVAETQQTVNDAADENENENAEESEDDIDTESDAEFDEQETGDDMVDADMDSDSDS